MLEKAINVRSKDLPDGYPKECADFINKCLNRQPHKRLGINGIDEVQGHPWFANFDWESLRNKTLQPTFVPDKMSNNFDDYHVNGRKWNDTEVINEKVELLRRAS